MAFDLKYFIDRIKGAINFIRNGNVNRLVQIVKRNRLSNDYQVDRIFIACFPKSGSTFVVKVLSKYLEWKYIIFNYDRGGNEQDIDTLSLIDNIDLPTVTHQHVRATNENIRKLGEFKIRPIILVRNIFDCVVSFCDHLNSENIYWPQISISKKTFNKLTYEEKLDHVIDFVVPWYINFYVSWRLFEQKSSEDLLWISYEDLVDNETIFFERILKYHKIEFDAEKLKKLIDANRTSANRFNAGIVGRGEKILNAKQKDLIRMKARFFDEINFGLIGLIGN